MKDQPDCIVIVFPPSQRGARPWTKEDACQLTLAVKSEHFKIDPSSIQAQIVRQGQPPEPCEVRVTRLT